MGREEAEGLWRSCVANAKLRYDSACDSVKDAEREIAVVPSPDGHFALQRALREENAARADYLRVIRLYDALIFDGTVPNEKEWLKRKAAGA